jgi:hypothetical protein
MRRTIFSSAPNSYKFEAMPRRNMVLLVRSGKVEPKKTTAAVSAIFSRRATHKVASALEPPPGEWASVFDALAKECGLAMKMDEGFGLVRDFTKGLKA